MSTKQPKTASVNEHLHAFGIKHIPKEYKKFIGNKSILRMFIKMLTV